MQGMITRSHLQRLEDALAVQAGVVLLGPRQVGKTTLAQDIADGSYVTEDKIDAAIDRLIDDLSN